jgi:hypothetical protein
VGHLLPEMISTDLWGRPVRLAAPREGLPGDKVQQHEEGQSSNNFS